MWNDTLILDWIKSCENEPLCLNFVNKLKNVNSSSILLKQTILNSTFHQTGQNELDTFQRRFAEFHGITGFAVCIIGVFVSILTLSILCRKKLRTATNLLLSTMAVSDMLTMLFYMPLLLTMYVFKVAPIELDDDLVWKAYYLFSIMSTATCHTYSVWVGVALSMIRLCQVRKSGRYPTIQNKWMMRSKVSMLVSFVIAVISLLPYYCQICHQALSHDSHPEVLDFKKGTSYSPVLFYAILSKITPSVLMTSSVIYIIIKTTSGEAKRRRATLRKGNSKGQATTKLLILLISLFVISELPQGIIMILGICWPDSFSVIYHLSGDLYDFVAILVSSINFVLYCVMSKQFRSEFVQVYLKCVS